MQMDNNPQSLNLQEEVYLLHGYRVLFRWTGTSFEAKWAPHVPNIKKARQRRAFLAAYREARDGFLAQVATAAGVRIGCADADPDGSLRLAVLDPATRH